MTLEPKTKRRRILEALLVAILLIDLFVDVRLTQAAEALPELGTDLDATSVSGLSSGAYMAGQIELAHAQHIKGAGIVAGGPFACAESLASRTYPFWPMAVGQNASQALYQCMKTTMGAPDPVELVKRAKELAAAGAIDPLSALASHNVYLFSGNEDQTVARSVVEAAKRFYEEAGVPANNIELFEAEGGHAFITEQGGVACGVSEEPFVNDCDYDQAKAILAWIYGPLASPSAEPKGRFIVFDQSAFAKPDAGLADEGVVYVPPDCVDQSGCRVHVAIHGCQQSREKVGDAFVKGAGFAEVADSNRLVILFPQVKASTINPDGCWDWWGYTGLDYLSKNAPQIAAIWAMVEHLASKE
jgi:poly(3-hydroxybutyrate) depolymerase